ncbi:hypothetical protein LEQ41_04685 [Streptococcus agalactiae]|nr:hypothetical protein [Streptococcus agalactiae]
MLFRYTNIRHDHKKPLSQKFHLSTPFLFANKTQALQLMLPTHKIQFHLFLLYQAYQEQDYLPYISKLGFP